MDGDEAEAERVLRGLRGLPVRADRSRPDQVTAAEELTRLRDRCMESVADNGSGETLDVSALRAEARTLLERVRADDSEDTYLLRREGVEVPITRQGAHLDSFDLLKWRLESKYLPRPLTGWIIGTILTLPGLIGIILLIKCITISRDNRQNAHFYVIETESVLTEYKRAQARLAERHAAVERSRTEAETAYADVIALLDLTEGVAPAD